MTLGMVQLHSSITIFVAAFFEVADAIQEKILAAEK